MKKRKNAFLNPDNVYRGTDLWMLNGRLEDEELVRQIRELKAKGFYSFIARTYNGLDTPYPSREFNDRIKTIIQAAKREDMKVVLQAGYMPSAVLGLPPECALHYIKPLKKEELVGNETILCEHDGIAYTDKTYTIALNMFDPKAVDYYIGRCYEDMWAEFREEYGRTVSSVWVDEPRFNTEYIPWSPDFEAQYRAMWGEALTPYIYQLYSDEGDHKRTRYRFRVMMMRLLADTYYSKIRAWCHAHGLTFSGHLMAEETTLSQIENALCVMPYYKYFDVPGIDFLCADLDWSHGASRQIAFDPANHYVTPLQCVSASHQAGKEHILCEMFGVTTTHLTFRSQRHIFDNFASMGINHRCSHAIFYSFAGFRKRFYPHQFNDCEPYWESYKDVNDYFTRVSQFVSFGKPVGNILLIHPIETAFMLHRGAKNDNNGEVKKYDTRFTELVTALFAERMPTELGDQMTIADCASVDGDKFRVGEMTYDTVVLPHLEVLNEKTLRLLSEFRERGGEVIMLGTVPDRLDGECSDALRHAVERFSFVSTDAELLSLLQSKPADYTLRTEQTATGIKVNHRKEGDTHFFMVYNLECRSAVSCTLALQGSYSAMQWFAEDGDVRPLAAEYKDGESILKFDLPEGSSILLSLEKGEATLPTPLPTHTYERVLGGDWEARLAGKKNLLTLDVCRIRLQGERDFSAPMSVYGVNDFLNKGRATPYSGPIELLFEFTATQSLGDLALVVEEPEKQEIFLNDVKAESQTAAYFYSREFKVVPLTGMAQSGKNAIILRREYVPAGKKPGDHLLELFVNNMGSEIEPVYLYGDFRVNAVKRLQGGGSLATGQHFTISPAREEPFYISSSISGEGYPFYVGDLSLTKTFTLTEEELDCRSVRYVLRDLYAATAKLIVNGRECKALHWTPYEAEILPLLQVGENKLELLLKTTFRNMIGPHHFKHDNRLFESGAMHPQYWKSTEKYWMCDIEGETSQWSKNYLFVEYGACGDSLKFTK